MSSHLEKHLLVRHISRVRRSIPKAADQFTHIDFANEAKDELRFIQHIEKSGASLKIIGSSGKSQIIGEVSKNVAWASCPIHGEEEFLGLQQCEGFQLIAVECGICVCRIGVVVNGCRVGSLEKHLKSITVTLRCSTLASYFKPAIRKWCIE